MLRVQLLFSKVLFTLIPGLSFTQKSHEQNEVYCPKYPGGQASALTVTRTQTTIDQRAQASLLPSRQIREKSHTRITRHNDPLEKNQHTSVPSPGFLGKCYFGSRQPQEHFIIKSQRCKIYIGKKCFARAM